MMCAASDASGRYRGQFMFDNNHWLGSILECDGLTKIDEMELNFFVASTLVASPEPLIEVCIMLWIKFNSLNVVRKSHVMMNALTS